MKDRPARSDRFSAARLDSDTPSPNITDEPTGDLGTCDFGFVAYMVLTLLLDS